MSAFTGSLTLAGLALRRDRIQLSIWVLALTGVVTANVAGNLSLYATAEERSTQAALEAGTAVSLIFNGPAMGASRGAIAYVEAFAVVSVMTAVMSLLAVVRHTRQNEENSRAEMIGSMVVGRYAGLVAALLVAVSASTLLGVLTALALTLIGLPAAGSIAAAAGLVGVGVSFAGVAAVTAQISSSARAANGMAAAAVGAAFLLRAIGDVAGTVRPDGISVTSAWPSWLSPFGWSQQALPYAENRWWVLALPLALFAVLLTVAFVLVSHRDFGQGLIGARPGPAAAPRSLLSPLGLAWRIHRGVLLAWLFGLILVSVGIGAVGNEVDDILSASDQVREIFERAGGGGNLTDAFFATTMSLSGIAVGGYALQALLRMRTEETGPLEPVLATSTGRARWVLSHVLCAAFGVVVLLLSIGLSTGVAYTLATGNDQIWRLTEAALVQLPACLALAGFTVAVFGLLPRLSVALSWAALAACLLIQQLGDAMRLPQAVRDVSPYTHTPALPGASLDGPPLVWIVVVALAMAGFGLVTFRRRDLSF